ncbi:Got1/Sft2-like family-domain-containing protein [Melampsora americana]|nr:Got1/Sft2-like family-domain-containing protein [Melampsora americana]
MPTSTPKPNLTSESNFKHQFKGFKWSRGVTDDSIQNPSQSQSQSSSNSNFFSRFNESISGYVPLRSNERSNEEEAYYALSRWERTIGFLLCIAGASICFFIAFLTLPFLAFKPRKFAVAFSLGSSLFMIGFMILQGPIQHLQHLFSLQRLPFTLSYFISLFATFYFAIGLHSYLGTLIASVIQVIALLSYFLAYFPGGLTTLKFMGSMGLRGATSYLPI